jgi:hypothetical protein
MPMSRQLGPSIAHVRPALICGGMLTLRPTRLDTSPVYAHLKDYTVFEDGTPIGRIYEQRPPAPPDARWLWSVFHSVPGRRRPLKMDGRAASFEDAKAQFAAAWEAFKAGGDSDSTRR